MTDFPKWPSWKRNAAGEARLFESADTMEPGWMDLEDYLTLDPLDHDGDGRPGGSLPKRQYRRRTPK